MGLLIFEGTQPFGQVSAVDTSSVVIEANDEKELQKLRVNHLVAIRSSKAGHHLIGLIEKIMRKAIRGIMDDSDEMDDDGYDVENIIRVRLIGTFIDKVGMTENVFRRTLESVPEISSDCYQLDGEVLTGFMRGLSSNNKGNDTFPLSLGTYSLDDEAEAYIDANRLFQRHAVIVGSTGSGKSWTVARVIEQAAELPMVNALVFDIHGEYQTLESDGIQHLRIAGPGDDDSDDCLENGVLFLPYWLLTYEEMIAMLVDRSDQNAPNQTMIFSRGVRDAKEQFLSENKKDSILPNLTVDSPVPYSIDDVLEELQKLDLEMVPGARQEKQGPFHGKLTRFVQRLEAKKLDRRLHFLFGHGKQEMEYEWFAKLCKQLMTGTKHQGRGGIKIIDFSEVPSDVLPLVVGLLARLVLSIQQWADADSRHPLALFCDEAHLYIPQQTNTSELASLGFQSFERIAKEGRKYGVGLVIVSQRPAEVNRTVLSQCNNFISMRLLNPEDQAVIRRLLPDSLGNIAEVLPILDVGEALVVGDAAVLPTRIKVAEPNSKPTSSTVNFWDVWSKDLAPENIDGAVESLRKQSKTRVKNPPPAKIVG